MHSNNNHNSYNRNNQNAEKPIRYFLKDIIDKEVNNPKAKSTQIQKDNKKIKKILGVLLIEINENNEDIAKDSPFFNDAIIIFKKIYESFSKKNKDIFLYGREQEASNKRKENEALYSKFETLLKDAKAFISCFRNFTMHNYAHMTTEEINKKFNFKKLDGELFTFFRKAIKQELYKTDNEKNIYIEKDKSKKEINFFETIRDKCTPEEMEKNKIGRIPLCYALATLAIFVEKKDMNEVLTLIKLDTVSKNFVLQFCLRGGYKVITSTLFEQNVSDELYMQQERKAHEIEQLTASQGRRLLRNYKYFTGEKEIKDLKHKSEGKYYADLLRFSNFENSYPRIDEFEIDVSDKLANDLKTSNLAKIERTKKGSEATGKKKDTSNIETDFNKLKAQQTNVFRKEGTTFFIKEAMAFLSDHDNTWFGNNWKIGQHSVLWRRPAEMKDIYFDLRRKVTPSSNALNSIYKIVYKHEDGSKEYKVTSLNYKNLLALTTAVVLGKKVDFEKLINTTNNAQRAEKKMDEEKSTKERMNQAQLNVERCKKWKKSKQGNYVAHFIKMFTSTHIHCEDSINIHNDILKVLYRLDGLYKHTPTDDIKAIFARYGAELDDSIMKVLGYTDLTTICQKCIEEKAKMTRKRDENAKKTYIKLHTWGELAFYPKKGKNPISDEIKEALGWEDSDIGVGDLLDLLVSFFEKNNYAEPNILGIYRKNREDKISIRDILARYKNEPTKKRNEKLRREQKIRDILVCELLYTAISYKYVEKLKNNQSYIKIEAKQSQGEKRSPLNVDIIFDFKPKQIKISFEEYNKKDVRMALNYIFDSRRIGFDKTYKEKKNKYLKEFSENIDKMSDEVKSQKCFELALGITNYISSHETLSSKFPDAKEIVVGKYYTAKDIKLIASSMRWFVKEMLGFIVTAEGQLIWMLEVNNIEYQPQKGYYEFRDIVYKIKEAGKSGNHLIYRTKKKDDGTFEQLRKEIKLDDITWEKIWWTRNNLAHGYFESANNYNYKEFIKVMDNFFIGIGRKTIKEEYAKKGGRRR